MGVIYYVVCRDCCVKRCLDKFYALLHRPKDRDEAFEFADLIEKDGFGAGLLVSFMGEHSGHNCTIVSDTDIDFPDATPEEAVDWWDYGGE